MTQNAFDAAGFIQVDLETGTIKSPSDSSMALLPMEILSSLAPTQQLRDSAKQWGARRGEVFLSQVEAESGDMDTFSQHIQGDIALIGAGRASIDVYGNALLFKLQRIQKLSAVMNAVLESFLAGYLSVLYQNDFSVLSVQNRDDESLLLAGNATALQRVKSDLNDGISPMTAVERLHQEVA